MFRINFIGWSTLKKRSKQSRDNITLYFHQWPGHWYWVPEFEYKLMQNIAYCSQSYYFGAWSIYALSFSFSIYCQTLFRVLWAGVLCTLRVAGWKPTSNHIEITVGFFNLHKGWLSLHRGHKVNVLIRRTMDLSSVIPANDTRESVFGHRNFPRRKQGSHL